MERLEPKTRTGPSGLGITPIGESIGVVSGLVVNGNGYVPVTEITSFSTAGSDIPLVSPREALADVVRVTEGNPERASRTAARTAATTATAAPPAPPPPPPPPPHRRHHRAAGTAGTAGCRCNGSPGAERCAELACRRDRGDTQLPEPVELVLESQHDLGEGLERLLPRWRTCWLFQRRRWMRSRGRSCRDGPGRSRRGAGPRTRCRRRPRWWCSGHWTRRSRFRPVPVPPAPPPPPPPPRRRLRHRRHRWCRADR